MRREDVWLADIVTAADTIARSLADQSFDTFLDDPDARDATLYRLIVIGEAVSRLPPELRRRYPEIPWQAVVGFRNRAVHAYFAVDWAIVWDTATQALPLLRGQVAAILARDYPSSHKPGSEDG
jgi:uncharacterized protein with HEPN domain